MKTAIIANPRAGAHGVGRRWKSYNRAISTYFGPAEVRLTEGANDATNLTRQALTEGFERIVVVGGDGTLNECVNGFYAADGTTFIGEHASLVLYPAGTGGDFCRSIGMTTGSLQDVMQGATEKLCDLGCMQLTTATGQTVRRYFVNISSFGASGQIVDRVNRTSKVLGGRVSFLLGTLQGLFTYKPQWVRLVVDDQFDEELLINTVVVANARYFGGSMKIAPDALVDDGLFDVVIIENIGLPRFVRYSRRLYQGRHVALEGIRTLRGRHVVATPLHGHTVLLDVDGEQPGQLPVTYDIVPQRLRVYAPWERAEAFSQGH